MLRVQSQFRVEVRREGCATVIAVSGELDLATSGALGQELERVESADAALLILDLGAGVHRFDAPQPRGQGASASDNRRVALVTGSRQVQRF